MNALTNVLSSKCGAVGVLGVCMVCVLPALGIMCGVVCIGLAIGDGYSR